MRLSRRGAKFIAGFEGYSATPYQGPGETYLTIGYGHYGPDVRLGMRWSRRKALRVLRRDAQSVADALARVPTKRRFTRPQRDALISAGFNLGPGVFAIGRSLGDAIRHGSKFQIGGALLLYTRGSNGERLPGLVRRRAAERRIFLRGYRR